MAGKGQGKASLASAAAGLMRRRRRLDEEEERQHGGLSAKGRGPPRARADEGAGKGARGGPKPPSQPPPEKLLGVAGSQAPAKARPFGPGKGPIAPIRQNQPPAQRMHSRQPAWQEDDPPQRKLPSKAKKPPAWQLQAPPLSESTAGFPRDTIVGCALLEDTQVPELLEGLTVDGWAYSFDGKKQGLCSQVDQYLEEVLGGDDALLYSEGNNQQDDSWEKFPEVGAALRETVPEIDECFCIAVCREAQVWAVGVGAKGRNRYYASRVALAMRLLCAAQEVGEMHDISSYPALEEVFSSLGAPAGEEPPTKKARTTAFDAAERPARQAAREPADGEASEGAMPRDTPFYISLLEDDAVHEKLEGMPLQGLAVATTARPGRLFNKLDDVLSLFVEEAEIEYLDDPDWSRMPEVGNAVARVFSKEEQLCVAVCPARNMWAVGLAARGHARWQASKLAIAASLVLQYGDELDLDLSAFPDFQEFVDLAKTAM
mmetsp:Transcript_45934/g.106799  ORF Transcript_45934/g.106799 Transcript_45934/m.106799 type:complete len:488 (-) Transcript_45934:186-1649(-)